MPEDKNKEEDPDFSKILIATGIGILLLGGITYAGYKYSQRNSGSVTLPGGVTYLGPTPQGESQPTAPQYFTVEPNTPWLTLEGKLHSFTFSYPSTLPLAIYRGDPADTISINWGGTPPEQNVLLNVETIDNLDPKYINLPKEEYVKNWWRQFSGLKGVKNVTPFTNVAGMKGFKARYIDWSDNAPVENIFFEVPKNPKIVIHLANGVLDQTVFDRIIHSVNWVTTTSTPAAP